MNQIAHCMKMATDDIAPPLQSATELARFLALLNMYDVKSYLEIGARYGGTFEAVMNRLPRGSRGVAIDFPGGEFGEDGSAGVLVNTIKRLRSRELDAHVIFGPSAAPEVVERAKRAGPYDLIFIDGDHSYEAVKRDFELYSPIGRIIALHDIAADDDWTNKAGRKVEVGRFWREISKEYKTLEIVAPGAQMGIGVIFK